MIVISVIKCTPAVLILLLPALPSTLHAFGRVRVLLDVSTCSGACVAETGNDAHAAKLLHSLLYTHLLKVDLLSAVEFIDSLVVQANFQSAIESHPLTETPPIQPSFMTFITNTLKSQV